MTYLSVSSNFDDQTIFSQQHENHYQYEKNVAVSLSYSEETRSPRVISESVKESMRKEHTIIILQEGASHQHDSSINSYHPDIRILCDIAIMDKTWSKIE